MDAEDATIITIDGVGAEWNFRRRMIKVNDRRSYVQGRPVMSANEVQWADPTSLSTKSWNFLIPTSVLSAGGARDNSDGSFDTELTRLRGVRSIEKAICLSKLGFFGDKEGLELIQDIENCEEVRRITEDRIAAKPDSGLTSKWLQTLGHVLFNATLSFSMRPESRSRIRGAC